MAPRPTPVTARSRLDSNGQLVTASGYAVQPAITIPADAQTLTIASDGTVSVTQAGSSAPVTVGTLQLATFINPAGLQSLGENLYAETASSGTPERQHARQQRRGHAQPVLMSKPRTSTWWRRWST